MAGVFSDVMNLLPPSSRYMSPTSSEIFEGFYYTTRQIQEDNIFLTANKICPKN